MLLPFAVFPAAGRAPQGITFLTVPALIYLAVAMASRMNIGVRHILPIFRSFLHSQGGPRPN